jgi:hypothetical protein
MYYSLYTTHKAAFQTRWALLSLYFWKPQYHATLNTVLLGLTHK